MTPPSVSREERRAQILTAAIACFTQKGYHRTTMDDIVAACGLSKGSLYWHFKNKKDVLVSATKWYFDQLAGNLMPMLESRSSVMERLELMLTTFAQVMDADNSIFRVFIDFYAETRHDPEIGQMARDLMLPYIEMITRQFQLGVDNGELKPVNPQHMAIALMATFDGLFLYQMILGDDFEWRQIGEEFGRMVLGGIRAEK